MRRLRSIAIQVLGGIADTVAQTLTAIQAHAKQHTGDLAIELPDFDRKSPAGSAFDLAASELLPSTRNRPASFDFERLTRFMAYGFMMSPLQFHWFGFLSRSFPMTKQSGTIPALKRVACDQLMFAPVGRAKLVISSLQWLTLA